MLQLVWGWSSLVLVVHFHFWTVLNVGVSESGGGGVQFQRVVVEAEFSFREWWWRRSSASESGGGGGA